MEAFQNLVPVSNKHNKLPIKKINKDKLNRRARHQINNCKKMVYTITTKREKLTNRENVLMHFHYISHRTKYIKR